MPHPSGRPWIIAHRGASLVERENTLAAFCTAVELGADAVELDVRCTTDGVLVVHHDAALEGAERPIAAMTRSEVRDLDPDVPDLATVLAACRDIWVDVEIKNDPTEPDFDESRRVASMVADSHGDADIVVTSFDTGSIDTARDRGLRTGWLLGRGIEPASAATEAAAAGHAFVLPHHSLLADEAGPPIVAAARAVGVEVAVWTVDDPGEMVRLAAIGVGGIATNAPDVAVSALREHGDSHRR